MTTLRFVPCLVLSSLLACGCASKRPPSTAYVAAHPISEPGPSTTAPQAAPATAPSGAALAGQLRRVPPPRSAASPLATPQEVVAQANRQASQGPTRDGYFNAIVDYAFEPGSLFQVYAAPMRITDIALEPGEKVLGQPAAGDVVRWVLAIGKSMVGDQEQTHVYLKPTRPDLETNLAINTDRRSYMLELHSYADTYMAAVAWHYPHEEAMRLQSQGESSAADKNASPVVGLDALNFNYEIEVEKGSPAWTPIQAFDDGRRTFIRFPQAMLVREAPALFVLRNKETQLVNYRVNRDFYVVDRLIDSAQLRIGQQDQEIVRIVRHEKGRK